MRLTLIALLLGAVVGCGQTPAGKPEKNVGKSEPVIGNEGSVSENLTGDNTTTDRSARSQFELTRKFEPLSASTTFTQHCCTSSAWTICSCQRRSVVSTFA